MYQVRLPNSAVSSQLREPMRPFSPENPCSLTSSLLATSARRSNWELIELWRCATSRPSKSAKDDCDWYMLLGTVRPIAETGEIFLTLCLFIATCSPYVLPRNARSNTSAHQGCSWSHWKGRLVRPATDVTRAFVLIIGHSARQHNLPFSR